MNDLQFLIIDEADKAADWLEYLPDPHYRRPRLTLFNLHSWFVITIFKVIKYIYIYVLFNIKLIIF